MIAWLKTLLLRDVWLKLFSLGLAVLVWFTVNSMANEKDSLPVHPLSLVPLAQRTFTHLPVVIMSSAQDTRLVHVNPKEVEVTVEGEPGVLNRLYDRDIRAIVDVTGIEAAHDMRTRIEVSTPPGVTRLRVDPEEAQVVFPPTPSAP